MKMAVLLLSAAYSNSNAFIDAGETVEVGKSKHQITEERARDMVKSKLAEAVELDDEDEDEDDHQDGLEALTVPELKELATKEGVDITTVTTKPTIIAAIRAHRVANA